MPHNELSGQHIQVVISVTEASGSQVLSIDPWNNCPSQSAREEGRLCNDCEFWGREVEGIDWYEYSLCLHDSKLFTSVREE
jgi:hypothetical protein